MSLISLWESVGDPYDYHYRLIEAVGPADGVLQRMVALSALRRLHPIEDVVGVPRRLIVQELYALRVDHLRATRPFCALRADSIVFR
jgi:hypothetical protein